MGFPDLESAQTDASRGTHRVPEIPVPTPYQFPTHAPVYPTSIKAQALDQCG